MPSDVRHPRPRRRSDIPPRSLQAGSGLTDGDSDAPSSGGKITRSMNFARGSIDKNPPAPKRIAWLDAARGICIILVVVGHAINGIQSAGMAAREGILANIYYFIYTFHMAAFFALSGMLAWPSVNKDAKRFFKNSLKHILYPYFLYTTIQILIMNIFSNNLNMPAPFGFFEFR